MNFENVSVKVENHQAIITVDLSEDLGKTRTGRATMIGTTRGWQAIFNETGEDGGLIQYSLNLNLVRKP